MSGLLRTIALVSCLSGLAASSGALAVTGADSDPNGTLSFQRLTPENGLSSSSVTSLLQDSRGYIWVGTSDGLNRYDGYGFKVFRFHPEDPLGLSGSFVSGISLDADGNLWVFPGIGGADVYDPLGDRFEHLSFEDGTGSPGPPHVLGIASDASGRVWVATRRGLYCREDRTTSRLSRAPLGSIDSENGDRTGVNVIAADHAGAIWLGVGRRVARLLPRTAGAAEDRQGGSRGGD